MKNENLDSNHLWSEEELEVLMHELELCRTKAEAWIACGYSTSDKIEARIREIEIILCKAERLQEKRIQNHADLSFFVKRSQ